MYSIELLNTGSFEMSRPRNRTDTAPESIKADVRRISGNYPQFYRRALPWIEEAIPSERRLMMVLNGYAATPDEIASIKNAIDSLDRKPRELIAELDGRMQGDSCPITAEELDVLAAAFGV